MSDEAIDLWGERKTFFVDVIIPIPVSNAFTYRVPFELNDTLINGARVVVPFGRSKLYTGLIVKIHEDPPEGYQAKYIESVLDEAPIITGTQYKLWSWMSAYYMAPIGDVMNAALPANFKLASETKIVLHPEAEHNVALLDDREFTIYEALELQGELDLKEISTILGIKTIQPVIKKMIEKRVLITKEDLKNKFTPKSQIFVELTKSYQEEASLNALIDTLNAEKRKEKQVEALLIYMRLGFKNGVFQPVQRARLEKEGASISSLNSLDKAGVFRVERQIISRLQAQDEAEQSLKPLSEDQATAFDEIESHFLEKDIVLLHGVTGSGKTEVYVALIQKQLNLGKQVLFLLPEIALTTQLIDRLSNYFGDLVGVYHSKFNQNERVEIWNEVLQDNPTKFRIIIGARSAVFLPFRNLGLIIIDEEHESSFKQYDPSPRYNARDTALVLAKLVGAKVLMGSATPAMETYFLAKDGKYGLVELNKRFGNLQLPEVLLADLKKERKAKTMKSEFSNFLMEEMLTALRNKEQIILFQNRRGYNPVWACEVCGWTPMCKSCDVSLTYHKHVNVLKCHYCSYYIPPVGKCPSCGSHRLKMIGFGTEKIEDELSILLPGVNIQRLDLDTTRQKNSYERILQDFDDRKIDILVGTQMVTKGLDFDNVSLVGVLDADAMLRRPDFRAFERAYQLMSQVAGRAGRKHKRGKVIIQTVDPEHHILQKVVAHDFIGLYEHELIERKNYNYPPFYKLIILTLKHKKYQELDVMSDDLARALRQTFGNRILGPEYPLVKKINNYYLKNIRVKIERSASQAKVKERIAQAIEEFYRVPGNKSCRIITDVDPL